MNNDETLIDLMRHGEPVGGKKYRGQIDDPLSDKGWEQMRSVVNGHKPWDMIIASSLSRCADFAREVSSQHNIVMEADERFKEIGFGDWEGSTAEELMKSDQEILLRFWKDPVNNTPPGAEAVTDFQSRIIAAWEDVLERYHGKHILIISHAGVMRMILRHVLNMSLDSMFRIEVPIASISRIRVHGRQDEALPRLVFHSGAL